jgi:DUF4097 and DUF4098 domain-containing protein YvlB
MPTLLHRRRTIAPVILPLALIAVVTSTGCDVITADLKHTETAEWRNSYQLSPGGRLEINNINGKITVEPASGDRVEVVALKSARAATPEAAKSALERIQINVDASRSDLRIATKVPRTSGWFEMGGTQVKYSVRVPNGADVKFTTVNGGVEVTGLTGTVKAEATNGAVVARQVSGTIEASTTNGGVDVELARVGEGGARLECTNGGLKLRLPSDAKATISASITNGGIDVSGISLETTEASRRRVEGRMNGGGPPIRIEGTNGGIVIASR